MTLWHTLFANFCCWSQRPIALSGSEFSWLSEYERTITNDSELITRSFHTNCTLESTLSSIFYFQNCDMCRNSLISRENKLTSAWHPKTALLRCITIEYHSSVMIGYFKNTRENPCGKCFYWKTKRYWTGLTQRVSMEDGSSGLWAPTIDLVCCKVPFVL